MSDGWRLVYEGIDPDAEGLREALCTLGNGRFATRGAAPWAWDDGIHYPGTYIAGGYNRLTSDVAGRDVVNEDLVNFPNWLPLTFSMGEGPALGEEGVTCHDVRLELDLRRGCLQRTLTARDHDGRETRVRTRRIVSMADPSLAAIEMDLVPLNWAGTLRVRASLDGTVKNNGVARYRELRGDHLAPDESGAQNAISWLTVRTKQSGLGVAVAARLCVAKDEDELAPFSWSCGTGRVDGILDVAATEGCRIRVEKVVSLRTTRDPALGDLREDALHRVERAPHFDVLAARHAAAWETLWNRYDIEVDVASSIDLIPHSIQQILRLHTFHLLQTASPHTRPLDVSVPARGLHGEAYRGHIFWDEMYLFPFYLQRDPDLARALLLYRFHRLGEARAAATAAGLAGAMFPWQSGSDGREETQVIHLNPKSGSWDPDHSHLQRHVSAAVAFDVWSYVVATDDRRFLAEYGAEMLIEIARLWASLCSKREDGLYEIVGVMGPDEFHEAYPGAERGGLRNNAYTNLMAAWCMERGLESLDLLDEETRSGLVAWLDVQEDEIQTWRSMISGMTIPLLPDGLIEQFEGYGTLEELEWEAYRAKYGHIGRLDRILKAEGDSPDRYKLSKQADLCMLFYLFDREDLKALLERTGYEMTEARMLETIEYYRRRTSHGSTLSHLVFAGILDRLDRDASWAHFVEALRSDVDDIQGGTTPEGIHTAVMAGTIRHLIERFAGVRLRGNRISVDPHLPEGFNRIRLTVVWHSVPVTITVHEDGAQIHVPAGADRPVPVASGESTMEVAPGTTREFPTVS